MDSITKKCSWCKIVKPVSEFHKQEGRLHGKRSECKECRNNKNVAYKSKNREKIREASRSEETKKRRRKNYSLNPEKQKQRSRDFIKNHPELKNDPIYKHKKVVDATKYSKKTRERVFDLLGRVCVRCGFTDMRALQIDHINGNGAKEVRELKGRHAVYRRALKVGNKEYQILCANCNWIKRSENNEIRKR